MAAACTLPHMPAACFCLKVQLLITNHPKLLVTTCGLPQSTASSRRLSPAGFLHFLPHFRLNN